jgi:hypothetical protein
VPPPSTSAVDPGHRAAKKAKAAPKPKPPPVAFHAEVPSEPTGNTAGDEVAPHQSASASSEPSDGGIDLAALLADARKSIGHSKE